MKLTKILLVSSTLLGVRGQFLKSSPVVPADLQNSAPKRSPETASAPKNEAKTAPKTEVKTAAKKEVKTAPKNEVKNAAKTEVKTAPKNETKTAAKNETKTAPKIEAVAKNETSAQTNEAEENGDVEPRSASNSAAKSARKSGQNAGQKRSGQNAGQNLGDQNAGQNLGEKKSGKNAERRGGVKSGRPKLTPEQIGLLVTNQVLTSILNSIDFEELEQEVYKLEMKAGREAMMRGERVDEGVVLNILLEFIFDNMTISSEQEAILSQIFQNLGSVQDFLALFQNIIVHLPSTSTSTASPGGLESPEEIVGDVESDNLGEILEEEIQNNNLEKNVSNGASLESDFLGGDSFLTDLLFVPDNSIGGLPSHTLENSTLLTAIGAKTKEQRKEIMEGPIDRLVYEVVRGQDILLNNTHPIWQDVENLMPKHISPIYNPIREYTLAPENLEYMQIREAKIQQPQNLKQWDPLKILTSNSLLSGISEPREGLTRKGKNLQKIESGSYDYGSQSVVPLARLPEISLSFRH